MSQLGYHDLRYRKQQGKYCNKDKACNGAGDDWPAWKSNSCLKAIEIIPQVPDNLAFRARHRYL
jgi:hypothetical protein